MFNYTAIGKLKRHLCLIFQLHHCLWVHFDCSVLKLLAWWVSAQHPCRAARNGSNRLANTFLFGLAEFSMFGVEIHVVGKDIGRRENTELCSIFFQSRRHNVSANSLVCFSFPILFKCRCTFLPMRWLNQGKGSAKAKQQ